MPKESSMETLVSLSHLQATMEHDLARVKRWNQFQESNDARPQTTLAHTASIMLAAIVVVNAEQRHNPRPFNAGWIYETVALHDLGEMCRADDGCDVLFPNKSTQTDKDEIVFFDKTASPLPIPIRELFRSRYLTQFFTHADLLSEEQKELVLRGTSHEEVEFLFLIFDAIEKYDYLLFAYNEFRTKGNECILVSMLRTNYSRLIELACTLPGFGQEVINPDVSSFASHLLAKWDGVEINQIPDRFAPKKATPSDPLRDDKSA